MVNSSQAARQILEGLNENQREAVETIDGPLLILAGPGSGKTRVITQRIAYLVRVVGVSPYRIGAVTFTNKAAREMRARLTPSLGPAAEHVTAKTFHTFCAQVLRQEGESIGVKRDFVIYDDSDQMSLMKRVMKELELDPKRFAPRAILSAISSAKSQLLGFEGLSYKSGSYFEEIVVRAYEHYEGLLQKSSALDFDDLLLKTYQLFDRVPESAKKYQERYVHFMVDEFQDTNVAQYAIAKQVAYAYSNICVVGDPDQSIYTWRNADIRNILSFQDDYPQAKVIALEENYRSTQTILDAAKSLIAANTQRVDKDLWTQNGEGVPIVVSEGYNEGEEAQFVVKEIQSLTRGRNPSYKLGDVAVMYRVNAQSRALEESCLRYGMPYQVVGGLKFYQRQEVKDVTAYLRLIANSDDDVSLERVINTPTRGIGQRTVDELTRLARNADMSMFSAISSLAQGAPQESVTDNNMRNPFPARSLRALTDFHDLIRSLQAEREKSDLLEIIDSILERTGYQSYLMDQSDRGEERLENIQEFKASARDFLMFGRDEALTAFLESVSLVADVDSMEDRADAITLITLHQAKGLEFPVVFMVGMEEGLLPHVRSLDDPAQLEEERRLCYVGVTRARERLYLCRSFRRGFRGGSEPSVPSRFLLDIPAKLITAPVQNQPKSKTIKSAAWTPGARRARNFSGNSENASSNGDRSERPARPDAATTAMPHFSTGDKVKHKTFGEGIVVECKPSHEDFEVTVAFKDGAGVKRLMQGFAKLEKVE
ncbi:MAG: UvrD-helicase domain-containing protein [Chloroflexi bacterium]|nr:UvrD-helicase domain-containing protein [Chloroflexota bacterium]